MAAFLGRKVIILASKLLRKALLGSKLGDSGCRNPFMWVSNRCRAYTSKMAKFRFRNINMDIYIYIYIYIYMYIYNIYIYGYIYVHIYVYIYIYI